MSRPATPGLVRAAKAFSEPTRIRILHLLRSGELCVCDLITALDVTQSTLSTHLKVIRDAGLVTTRRSGKWIHYSLSPHGLVLTKAVFHPFAAELAADRTHRRDAARLVRSAVGRGCEGEGC